MGTEQNIPAHAERERVLRRAASALGVTPTAPLEGGSTEAEEAGTHQRKRRGLGNARDELRSRYDGDVKIGRAHV